jgi:chaperonin cofactor prefoldin
MADSAQSHHHPDYDQRIKAVEEQLKKLQQQLHELQRKLETHDHPHTHSSH